MLAILEKPNNRLAVGLIAIAAFFWGLIAPIVIFAENSAVGINLTLVVIFGLTVSDILLLLACYKSKISITHIFAKTFANKELARTTIIRTIVGVGYFMLLPIGLSLIENKMIGSIILNSAPLIAILMSYHYLKDHLSHINKSILLDWLLILIAFSGVVILSLGAGGGGEIYTGQTANLLGWWSSL